MQAEKIANFGIGADIQQIGADKLRCRADADIDGVGAKTRLRKNGVQAGFIDCYVGGVRRQWRGQHGGDKTQRLNFHFYITLIKVVDGTSLVPQISYHATMLIVARR